MNDADTIDRRELLRRAAVLLGGSLSAPAVIGVMNGCSAHAAEAGWKPVFFSEPQIAVVAEIAHIMIPPTDTPGARDVGVPAFIDTMLAATYPAGDQKRYLTGLAAFEADAQRQTGSAFLSLGTAQRQRFVQSVHDAALAAGGSTGVPRDQRPFILTTKELVLLGFFTSREGATLVLQHDPLPGAYHGCLPLAEAGNGRTWATEQNLPF